ncbi:hypothetical protein L873DRAFT_594408 [Choiromyces venosus 120613-1]|uniref:Transmembrane protein n=1 Tax=Choiromyces venosus 120613-1 TaxID=1336337 RepID=A0A3N4JTQ5_9PEZI|nr:hypothetical protein L873DRAFT_594408 [Choiromyces venosus 120613-1]
MYDCRSEGELDSVVLENRDCGFLVIEGLSETYWYALGWVVVAWVVFGYGITITRKVGLKIAVGSCVWGKASTWWWWW